MAKVKKSQVGSLVKKYKDWKAKSEADKNYTRASFKTADSLKWADPKSKTINGILKESKSNRAKADSIEKAVEKRVGVPRNKNPYDYKAGGKVVAKKAQSGAKMVKKSAKKK